MTFSTTCFIVSLVLGLLSMGLLGQLIYWFVSPILKLKFPPMKSWTGDWIWPAMIYISVLWPFGFLIAGWAGRYMIKFNCSRFIECCVYVGILLLWGLLLWLIALTLLPKPKFSRKVKK